MLGRRWEDERLLEIAQLLSELTTGFRRPVTDCPPYYPEDRCSEVLLFPDGRLPSHRWRPAVWLEVVAVVCFVAFAFDPGTLPNLGLVRVSNPFGIEGAAALLATLGWLGLFMTLAVAVAGAPR